MTWIDLNADLGEGMAFDDQLMNIISSASIACGGHAGNREIMAATLSAAKQACVVTGAHPGLEDRENFGRKRLNIPVEQIIAQVIGQLQTITAIARKVEQPISYVKLHGALYNWASQDLALASRIFSSIREFDPSLFILAMDGSAQIQAAELLGLNVISEAFADRTYRAHGKLVSRTERRAVIEEPHQVVKQALGIAREGQIIAHDGTRIVSNAKSLCLHGDNKRALEIAREIHKSFVDADIKIRSFI